MLRRGSRGAESALNYTRLGATRTSHTPAPESNPTSDKLLRSRVRLFGNLLGEVLREQAGEATYTGAFVAHWLDALLYYQAPAWVFALVYTLFGLLVLFAWFRVPPRGRGEAARR